jgi:ubiquitin thioesterase OTU1
MMLCHPAAMQTDLTHRGSKFYKGGVRVSPPAGGSGALQSGGSVKLRCSDCDVQLAGTGAAEQHAKATGHKNFEQAK